MGILYDVNAITCEVVMPGRTMFSFIMGLFVKRGVQ